MSHYWEVLGEQSGRPFAMHGEQAAVGTVLALRIVELIRDQVIDFDKARNDAIVFDYSSWESDIRRTYGVAADAIIELEQKAQKNASEGRLRRISAIEAKWHEVVNLFNTIYPSEKLRTVLKNLGCPADPVDIGITPEILKDTLMVCKETRARYTVLQLAWDLSVLDSLSDQIISELKSDSRI
jgi:glycerol-1-phosphate dehydrogenase [NAD(P)+]